MLTSLLRLSKATIRFQNAQNAFKRFQNASNLSQTPANALKLFPTTKHSQHPKPTEPFKRSQTFPKRVQNANALPNALERPKTLPQTRRQSCTDDRIICELGSKLIHGQVTNANQPSTREYSNVPSLHCAIAICQWSCVVAL